MSQSEFEGPGPAGSTPPSPKARRWPRRVLWISLTTVCLLVLLGAGAFWFTLNRYAGNVDRVPDVFTGLDDSSRPPPNPLVKATTYLLIGTDTRSESPTTGAAITEVGDGSNADAIMLVQLAEGGSHASIISIPRDSWVAIPGHGMDKINAAYAIGGPTLLVQTVEDLTDVRIGHFAAIDFEGFKAITDALGGVTVDVATRTESRGVTFEPGPNRLDGASALIYVRQRYDLPGSDFDRVQRQQNFLRAVLTEIRGKDLLGSPSSSDKILRAITGSISIDDTLSNLDLLGQARQLQRLSTGAVDFLTAPVAGTGWEGQQNVVYLDQPMLEQMMGQLRDGDLPQNVSQYKVLPATPN